MKHNTLFLRWILAFSLCMCAVAVSPPAAIFAASNVTCPQHLGPPCPRYYNNTMADYKQGDDVQELLKTVRFKMGPKFDEYMAHIVRNSPPSVGQDDPSWFTGTTGRAALFLKSWAKCNDTKLKSAYLTTAKLYIDNAIKNTPLNYSNPISFFCGITGTYALGAVIYDALGNKEVSAQYIKQVQIAMPHGVGSGDFTFDWGVPGIIQSGLFLNWYFDTNKTIPTSSIDLLANYVIDSGIEWGRTHDNGSYLLWDFPETRGMSYGQGRGMFGTLQRMMDVDSLIYNKTTNKYMRNTIDWLVSKQLSDGQWPDPFNSSQIIPASVGTNFGPESDLYPLVQWDHGAPGSIPLFIRAWQIWGDANYLIAAEKAADYTWERGLIAKGLMHCHGISGNTYMFIILYRATRNEKYLWRALKFQEYVLDTPILSEIGKMRVPDPADELAFSAWQGSWVAASILWADMLFASPMNWCCSAFENHCL